MPYWPNRFLPAILVLPLCIHIGGCGQAVTRQALPVSKEHMATIPGMPGVRYWGDQIDPALQADFIRLARQGAQPANASATDGPGMGGLVISGGGDYGAYGAGVLCGWTEQGSRPRFRIVTGVSTGALIAPLAFLGPKYDAALRDSYTTVSGKDIYIARPFLDWLRYDSVADSAPLRAMAERTFTDEFIREVAAEHAKGRRLFIQTTNLDAQRPVIWDLGAIASASHPDAPKLFRQVLVASASVPGVFPPQYIRVEYEGKRYDEMHVDGGTSTQMLMTTLPVNLADVRKQMAPIAQKPFVYVIRNAFTRPEPKAIEPRLFAIAGRSISTLIKFQAHTELTLMYYEAQAAGIDLSFANIPDEFEPKTDEVFNNAEMTRLYTLGYEKARAGYPWSRVPPQLAHQKKP